MIDLSQQFSLWPEQQACNACCAGAEYSGGYEPAAGGRGGAKSSRLQKQVSRGLKGQKTCERLWTVVACLPRKGTRRRQGTCALQCRSAFDFIHAAVHAHFQDKLAPSLLPASG